VRRLDFYKIIIHYFNMNLTDYATRYPLGVKLSKAQTNLLFKLDDMGVQVGNPSEPRLVQNPVSGYSEALNPFVATLVEWVYRTYSTYDFAGGMNYKGAIHFVTYDRVRMLVLSLDSSVYSNFLD